MAKRFLPTATIASAAMIAATLGLASPVGAQTTTACGVAPAGFNVIESDARFVIGTPGPDFICAGPSNNIIRAQGMNDIIHAGDGNDVIWGGFGADTIFAGGGDDVIRAGGGPDIVRAGDGDDLIFAGTGPDDVNGGNGDDNITGGDGNDTLRGQAGNDRLVANKGIDRLEGGSGADVLQGGNGPDRVLGGAGNDVLFGGGGDDIIGGGDGSDRLLGGTGADELVGGNGDDDLFGGASPDVLSGGNGDDILDGGNGLNIGLGGPDADSCNNVDSPSSVCEIIDGIELANLPALITVLYPSGSATATIIGTDWSPSTDLDVFAPVVEQLIPTDANGDFTITGVAADIQADGVRVEDSVTGRIKTYDPILDSYSYIEATRTLTASGATDTTVETHVFDTAGTLIFIEQMTFDEAGTAVTDFREIDVPIGSIDIHSADTDGDSEIHQDIFVAP